MEHVSIYISILFMATTVVTVGLFYKATHYSTRTLFLLASWLILQAFIGFSGFYTLTSALPPRFLLLILPPLLLITGLFVTTKGRQYIDGLDTTTLTLLHTIRIPVELVLFGLFTYQTVPELMTFEGRNVDILSGLTAPLIFYFGFVKRSISKNVILIWNFICLGLLFNIVIHAILSAPFPFQQLAFDQPNIAVLYFPYVWLPGCVVPLVLFSHLTVIRQLLKCKQFNI